MALKFMANRQSGEGQEETPLTSAREVCDSFQTPFDTTAKVMQKMNNHHILTSVKGIKGGYSLAKPLSEITYMELVHIIEGKKKESFCETTKGLCECFDNCNIKSPIENLNNHLNQYLNQLTLEELLFKEGPEQIIRPKKAQECPGEELKNVESVNQASN